MDTYKIYRLYDTNKKMTVKQLDNLFDTEDIHFPVDNMTVIHFNEHKHTWKGIFHQMGKLDVSQEMFTFSSMIAIIQYFGLERYSLSFDYTEIVHPDTIRLIDGYAKRVENETNEWLRKADLKQLISTLHHINVEEDIDIKTIQVQKGKESFHVYNNGIIIAPSIDMVDKLISISL